MDPITINDLPPELVLRNQIFKRLNPVDLVELRRVCKLWNMLISSIKIDRLIADVDMDISERWFHSNRPCNEQELCRPNLFVSHWQRPMLSSLKYLKLKNPIYYSSKLSHFDLNKLNAFQQLIQLEIEYYLLGELNLCLPNLEVLSLNWRNDKCHIKLHLPKLRVLDYEYEDNDLLLVEHPETIRVLKFGIFGTKLVQFKNVECFRCSTYDSGFLDKFTLQSLQHLKEVHYDMQFNDIYCKGYEEIMQGLKDFMQLKRSLGRSNLKVYFVGLELIEEDLSDIEFGLKIKNEINFVSSERLYMKHYGRLKKDMDMVCYVNYNRLFSEVKVLPNDYFDRFSRLRRVEAKSPVDEQHFLDFLRKLDCLEGLSLWDLNLSQRFFDSLPKFCSLTEFNLCSSEGTDNESDDENEKNRQRAENDDDEIKLNFSFMANFVRLRQLFISKNLSLQSIQSLVPAFESMRKTMERYIWFSFQGHNFSLMKDRPRYDQNGKITNERYDKYCLNRGKNRLEHVDLVQEVDFFENWTENLKNWDDTYQYAKSSSDDEDPNETSNEGEIENQMP